MIWTTKDTVMVSFLLLALFFFGVTVYSGFAREALQDERDSLWVENVKLERELRLTQETMNFWRDQKLVLEKELDKQDVVIRDCNSRLSKCTTESTLLDFRRTKNFASLEKCQAEYDFMRSSLLNEYDVDVDTFPELINGLYVDGVVHAQVNSDIEQGLNTLCHEHLHYLIANDKVGHFGVDICD